MNTLPPERDRSVWIVLVDFNGLDDTRQCLRSLSALTHPVAVVVVDNASTDDVSSALAAEFPWAEFVRSPVNGGWAGGNNIGVRKALAGGAEWVILLNNDTVVPPRFAERLLEAARRHPEYGVLGPVILFLDEPDVVQTTGVVFNRPDRPGFFQPIPVARDAGGPAGVVACDIVNGCCLMIHRDVIAAVGLVDEQFFLVHEESDWCLRAQAVTKLGVVTDGLVWHKGSSTFKREGGAIQRYFDARNIVRLLVKHRRRRNARPFRAGFAHYVRYLHHRYCLEWEGGRAAGARAIVEGLYDGLAGRYGPPRAGWRPGISILKAIFEMARYVRSWSPLRPA